MTSQKTTIEISPKSVLLAIGILLGLLIAWQIRGVLIALFVAYVLMSGFAPLVDWLQRNGINRTISVAITYLASISFLALLLFLVIPPLVIEVKDFVARLPLYIDTLQSSLDGNTTLPGVTNEDIVNLLSSKIGDTLSSILSVALNALGIFISFITVAVFTFYLLLERDKIKKNLPLLFPNQPKGYMSGLANKIEEKLGAWVRGELILMIIIGTLTYIALTILGVEFALPLAIIAGLLELVPTMGPIISAVPAIIIAFVQNPFLAIAVGALYILIQQLENSIIVPKVMERAIGLSPLITILALLIGGTLFGLMGAVLAVPVAAISHVVLEDYFEKIRRETES